MYDVVIVGSGPAGLSASVYAKRAGLNAATFEVTPVSGGQILSTYEVDNYLGLPGISGMELGSKFREHADKLGCKFVVGKVTKINKLEDGFVLNTENGDVSTRCVVLATGATPAVLGVPGEEDLFGMGVSYCATCDGAFFKNKTVAVVGGGDVAVEDAIYLSRTCQKVYLIHRRDQLRATKILQEDLLSGDNVEVLWNTVVETINGEDQVEAATVKDTVFGNKRDIAIDGIFIAVGMNPVNELAKGLVNLDEKGFIMSGDQCITNVPGVFVAGDLRTKKLRQVVTAVADGANVITSVEAYLRKIKK